MTKKSFINTEKLKWRQNKQESIAYVIFRKDEIHFCQSRLHTQTEAQKTLYLHDEELYNQLMEDYDDKYWNENTLNKSNNLPSPPHTLLNPSYYDDKKDRRVKTPIEPSGELKGGQKDHLRTSGSYSIESLRNHKNMSLMFSKNDPKGHNTNHLKFKATRYPQNLVKNKRIDVRTMESKDRLGSRDCEGDRKASTQAKKFFDSKNISCLSSPYLNKANESYKNIGYHHEQKNNKEGYRQSQRNEDTKVQLRNQMMDLELLKLPSISPEEGITNGQKLSQIGTCKTGKNYIPPKQVIHPVNISMKKHKNAILRKDEQKSIFNAMLNKTRIDNLPPLQELSVFEQSFETRRKQPVSQALRSRSKNYRNFEGGSYITTAQKTADITSGNMVIQEDICSSEGKDHARQVLAKDKNFAKANLQTYESNDELGDNSLSAVSNSANTGNEILINTGSKLVKDSRKFPSHSHVQNREMPQYAKNI